MVSKAGTSKAITDPTKLILSKTFFLGIDCVPYYSIIFGPKCLPSNYSLDLCVHSVRILRLQNFESPIICDLIRKLFSNVFNKPTHNKDNKKYFHINVEIFFLIPKVERSFEASCWSQSKSAEWIFITIQS